MKYTENVQTSNKGTGYWRLEIPKERQPLKASIAFGKCETQLQLKEP